MARTEKEIEQLYENLRKTAGTDKSLNRINGTVVFMLQTMNFASAMPPRVDGFSSYYKALNDLYTMDASRANNKEEIIKALTTLDGFEDFLKQMPEGSEKTNYQLLVEKGGRRIVPSLMRRAAAEVKFPPAGAKAWRLVVAVAIMEVAQ